MLKLTIITICFLLLSCTERQYSTKEMNNPVFQANTEFQSHENLASPKFKHLVDKYQLDLIIHGEEDEFKRILLLRHWIKTIIAINDHGDPYPGSGNAEAILDAALKGQGFHCGHFMIVQNAIMNAFGYVTRTLGAGPGIEGGPDGHHGTNEIWLNKYHKWFLSDAKYDHHFEKDGIPLSALEVRNEYLKNKAADIVMVKGPGRTLTDIDPDNGTSKEQYAQTFTWIAWQGYNDMFSAWPDHKELLVMYNDEYFKTHTWIWDGKPHWAYDKPEFIKLVNKADSIYWTPNVITCRIKFDGDEASFSLLSATPNLKEYELKFQPAGEWIKVEDSFNLKLKRDHYELALRAVNLAGIAGPEYRVVIKSN